jgi:uncharacterized protein (DUF1330 family)
MPAYIIASIKICDRDRYPDYAAAAGPAVAKYGGRNLALADSYEVLEGRWPARRLVLIEFDTVEQAGAARVSGHGSAYPCCWSWARRWRA